MSTHHQTVPWSCVKQSFLQTVYFHYAWSVSLALACVLCVSFPCVVCIFSVCCVHISVTSLCARGVLRLLSIRVIYYAIMPLLRSSSAFFAAAVVVMTTAADIAPLLDEGLRSWDIWKANLWDIEFRLYFSDCETCFSKCCWVLLSLLQRNGTEGVEAYSGGVSVATWCRDCVPYCYHSSVCG